MTQHSARDLLRNKMIWISALGYFVDVYDLVLFGIVRVASLKELNIPSEHFLSAGTTLLNWQMAGMLCGGFGWGMLGDRLGRMKALYGSIFLYSIANILNAFVTDLPTYAALRFMAGLGLAGELGAAIALVSEITPKTQRGIGSAIIGIAGFMGAVAAALLGGLIHWKTSYLVGGFLGLLLLGLRTKMTESPFFMKMKATPGFSFSRSLKLFLKPVPFWRYIRITLVGTPIWYVAGILMYFSPEIASELNISGTIIAGQSILWGYIGSIVGDPLVSLLSQKLKSRKYALLIFLFIAMISNLGFFFFLRDASPLLFYFFCFLLGITNGYWTLFITMASEQFGTNLRATVSTSVPNVVRSMVIPMTALFLFFKSQNTILRGALFVGLITGLVSLVALLSLPDTFSKDLDYLES